MPDAQAPPAAIVLLAAGASRRLGRPKQLLDWHGTPLVAHAAGVALAARSGPVIVVVGHEAGAVSRALAALDVTITDNPDWAKGMSTSVRTGLAAAEHRWPGMGAVVLMTSDQPLVQPRTIRALAEAVTGPDAAPLAAADYGPEIGVPAAFARRLFPELLRLEGDRGAQQLLLRHAASARKVACPEAHADVDREADYDHLLRG